MNEIIPKLFISDWDYSKNKELLISRDIKAVITIETRPKEPDILNFYRRNGIDFMYIYLPDSPGAEINRYFDVTASFIDEYRKKGGVLVHCWAGVSRSVTIVLNYIIRELIKKNDISGITPSFIVNYALDIVRRYRPIAYPNPGFIKQLELQILEYKNKYFGTSIKPPDTIYGKNSRESMCIACRYK